MVCGNLTVGVPGHHDICPVCGWQDDGGDHRDPDRYEGGPNHVTLREARENHRATANRSDTSCSPPAPAQPWSCPWRPAGSARG
ncbi:CPCC family cysteine-rich protein [Streptomyces roseus]|uniref:CPCC family cysteine-rich protein n=1 Tax=Streptomyces roseus TaxID=66430 RepID=UPI00367D89F1